MKLSDIEAKQIIDFINTILENRKSDIQPVDRAKLENINIISGMPKPEQYADEEAFGLSFTDSNPTGIYMSHGH